MKDERGAPALVNQIAEERRLDGPADTVHEVSESAYQRLGDARGPVENVLRGKWMGHPLHPVLVDIPIGAWTAVTMFDVLSVVYRPFKRAADVSLVVGILTAPAAAVAGHADWMQTRDRARRIGLVHGVLNTCATGLYGMSLLARLRRKRGQGALLAIAGMSVATAAGYLGGALVFNEGVGTSARGAGTEE